MNYFLNTIKKGEAGLLYLYPLFYLFTGFYFCKLTGDLSLTAIDPDYVYFMSGVNISEGYFKVGHIDHPGSPLQYLIALVLRITWWFRKDAGTPYLEDVLGHPDLYLSVVNAALTTVVTLAIFVSGRYVWKKTGSVMYALLVQTIPFVPFVTYQIIGRVMPELLMPVPVLWLSAFLAGHLADKKETFALKDLLILSCILALALSIKLTMISLWIIPLIIVKPWRSKLIVAGLSVFLFLVFALPVLLQAERFWSWTSNLFLHSGIYGSGTKNIVESSVFVANFKKIVGLYKAFNYLLLFQLLLIPVSFFIFRQMHQHRHKVILSAAIISAIVFQVLITAKHFAPHYFLPAVFLAPLLLLVSIEMLKNSFPFRFLPLFFNVALLLLFVWHFNQQLININYASQGIGNHISAREDTRHYIQNFEEGSVKIIVSQGYGCPFPEYGLMFSTAWLANSLKPRYTETLAGLYPNTWQYTTFDDRWRHWGQDFNPGEIMEQNIPVYMYLEQDTEELYNKAIAKIFGEMPEIDVATEHLFSNPRNGEGLLRLHLSKNSKKLPEN